MSSLLEMLTGQLGGDNVKLISQLLGFKEDNTKVLYLKYYHLL